MMLNYLLGIAIQWKQVGIVIGIFCGLALLLCILILIVTKACKVETDEKVLEILSHLAGANCGGCGKSGCAAFAKCLNAGECSLDDCNPTGADEKKIISEILGIEFVAGAKTRAIVHCIGGANAYDKYNYVGSNDCLTNTMLNGGSKICVEGCVGEGSCMKVCPENTITMVDGRAFVHKDLCTSCGACINICPKGIISRVPMDAKIYIACSNKCKGREATSQCKVSCIACGICARVCPEKAITMNGNLPEVDYSKCTGCMICVEKCPRKCILEA